MQIVPGLVYVHLRSPPSAMIPQMAKYDVKLAGPCTQPPQWTPYCFLMNIYELHYEDFRYLQHVALFIDSQYPPLSHSRRYNYLFHFFLGWRGSAPPRSKYKYVKILWSLRAPHLIFFVMNSLLQSQRALT